jgi:hypothetical protein
MSSLGCCLSYNIAFEQEAHVSGYVDVSDVRVLIRFGRVGSVKESDQVFRESLRDKSESLWVVVMRNNWW